MRFSSDAGCTCPECVQMCRTYPCQPTAGEAAILLEKGYADLLMLKVIPAKNDSKYVIPSLCPAIVGFEKNVGPLQQKVGPCVFLKNDRCELHPLGLKPSEGCFSRHDTTKAQEEQHMRRIMATWLTEYGEGVIKTWETLCEIKIQGPKGGRS